MRGLTCRILTAPSVPIGTDCGLTDCYPCATDTSFNCPYDSLMFFGKTNDDGTLD